MDLDTLPPEFGFCDKLKTLDLMGNPIDNLPETLIECRHLSELKMNFKTFYRLLDPYMLTLIEEGKIRSEHIPQVVFEFESLHMLDLSHAKINSISKEHILTHLAELYLSNNFFFDIPEQICTIERLKVLDMSHNRITVIPEYFINLKYLEVLNFSYNKLTILPKNFIHLTRLKQLNLSHNEIDVIEKKFTKNKSLLLLDLSYNNLSSLPDELFRMEQLATLDLRYNKLDHIPPNIHRMIGLKSMNIFDDNKQRTGLHLIGNLINNPPSYIWKSTNIQTLYNFIDTKEKTLIHSYYHLKLILIGPKNVGKTTLVMKLLNSREKLSNTRKTIDMYVSALPASQQSNDNGSTINDEKQPQQKTTHDDTSSMSLDQWIENRISTSGDYNYSKQLKTKRMYPPPLKTYGPMNENKSIIHKSILISRNNLYCTIFDVTSEPSFEILYPLIFDSNALYILPVNLTTLLNSLHDTTNQETMNE